MKRNMLAFWILGAPYRPQATRAEQEQRKKDCQKEADKLINEFANDYRGEPDWKELATSAVFNLLIEIEKNADHKIEATKLRHEVFGKIMQDSKRIENRQDQVDKRAFQEAVSFNLDNYETKAEAIRDLREKPQFSIYPEKTLRGWMGSSVWIKPLKAGRPKKK